MGKKVDSIRKDYRKYSIDIDEMHTNPYLQFCNWFDKVLETGNLEANVMMLSTVDATNRPSSRIVLLKEHNEKGFVFFTNYESRKGKEIEQNPYGALLFWWADFERQVRIEGKIIKITEQESDAYFYSRPIESQIVAIVSNQSCIINDKHELINKYNSVIKQATEIKRPANWGGFMLLADKYEFWQGGAYRLHDRFSYEKKSGKWIRNRLQP